jgi:dCMP deaminase
MKSFLDKDRKSIHQFYIELAVSFSRRSKDPKTKVGAIIVTPEGILYPGYNGDEAGGSNQRESMESGGSGFIHAEENAIIKFNPTIHKGSNIYISHSPCKMCAKKIINTHAISKVYFGEHYGDSMGRKLLEERGIPVELINSGE